MVDRHGIKASFLYVVGFFKWNDQHHTLIASDTCTFHEKIPSVLSTQVVHSLFVSKLQTQTQYGGVDYIVYV